MQVKATFTWFPPPQNKEWKAGRKPLLPVMRNGQPFPVSSLLRQLRMVKKSCIENYTPDSMRYELVESNNRIEKCSVLSQSYLVYPCGQKFGRPRVNTKSYVPLIAEMFITGRGFMEETSNDPAYVDFAQITGIEMDGKDFEQLLPMIEAARKKKGSG